MEIFEDLNHKKALDQFAASGETAATMGGLCV